MQRILDLIEATLDTDVTPQQLAERSGYSLWHFLHLFRQAVGMPLQRYRTRRQLAHAIWHISCGMSVTDAALRWGFDTRSGFFRAFRREYGASPSAYLRTNRVREPIVPQLKEEVFLMLTREKFREALNAWGLDLPLTPYTHTDGGQPSESAMYAGDDFILKAYRDETACRLSVALAEALDAQGIPAALAMPLPDGRTALPMGDNLWITLCRRLPGEPMSAREMLLAPCEAGMRTGAALARLHNAAAALADTPYADDEPYADHLLNWALPRAQEHLPAAFPADYTQRLAKLAELPVCLVHRDPNPSNLIDCGDAVGFVDFDLSRRFVRIFDPCYTATAVLSETFGKPGLPWAENWPLLCESLLAGYDSVNPLTDAERQAVPTMLLGNEVLGLAAFAGSVKFREVFETNRRMLEWLCQLPICR